MAHSVEQIWVRCSKCVYKWAQDIEGLEFIQWQDKALTHVNCPACNKVDSIEFDLAINYEEYYEDD